MKYLGYLIVRVKHQGCNNYKVMTPSGEAWQEIACNLKTAKRWIEADRAEKLGRRLAMRQAG